MCKHIEPVATRTKFVILMHPKEYKKIKNGTGHFTHLSLANSELYVGLDFSAHTRVNALIDDPENRCYVLYPSAKSISLNDTPLTQENKTNVIFIIDATWDCSKKMLRVSENLQKLDYISFEHSRTSQFIIKQQPELHCLSTIESTLCVLELLTEHGDETLEEVQLNAFLNPFEAMVSYQQSRITDEHNEKKFVRFKRRRPV